MLATEMLRSHHDQLRGLMQTLSQAEIPDEQRQRVLDDLVGEMSLHEQIEDEIFYPAIRDVSALVTVSHAEHRELDDQIATVLRVAGDPERFSEELAVLIAAFEHHAQLEEHRMFPEVEVKLDRSSLSELGASLAQRLTRLRVSRLTQVRLRTKLAVMRRLS
jgi:iron-sulfur cluster repair protein YtfE (RIC family)